MAPMSTWRTSFTLLRLRLNLNKLNCVRFKPQMHRPAAPVDGELGGGPDPRRWRVPFRRDCGRSSSRQTSGSGGAFPQLLEKRGIRRPVLSM
jgi:hypothetical protein